MTAQTIAKAVQPEPLRPAHPGKLAARLGAARERTLLLALDLSDEQWIVPRLATINPPLWELAHTVWFQEYWCLRYRTPAEFGASLITDADALYNSALVAHESRWELPLLPLSSVLDYATAVLQRVYERLDVEIDNPGLLYFAELAASHEEMHAEAWTYTRQTLAYPAPRLQRRQAPTAGICAGDAQLPGGRYMLGAGWEDGFVFDNEKWIHPVDLGPFSMARTAVANEDFAAFVDDRGYERRELWCEAGWLWRTSAGAKAPLYWRKQEGRWFARQYAEWLPLESAAAVIHVNWYEADAWCRWAQRRLPTEAEWEQAAASSPGDAGGTGRKRRYPWGDSAPRHEHANLYNVCNAAASAAAFAAGDSAWGCRQLLGNVWEWTADWFHPYPGFVRDPYKEYSEPWFGNHKVLRGGSYATSAALLRNTWRNFYTPERRDVFAGFRTCAM